MEINTTTLRRVFCLILSVLLVVQYIPIPDLVQIYKDFESNKVTVAEFFSPTGTYQVPITYLVEPEEVLANSTTFIDNSTTISTEVTDIYSDETTIITDMSVTYVGNIHSDAGIMRNLNAYSQLIPFTPTTESMPEVLNHVTRLGNYSALYDGFYNLDIVDILNQAIYGKGRVAWGVSVYNQLVGELTKTGADISPFSGIPVTQAGDPSTPQTIETTYANEPTQSAPQAYNNPQTEIEDKGLDLFKDYTLAQSNIIRPDFELEYLEGKRDANPLAGSSRNFWNVYAPSREDRILGEDINLLADSISVTEYNPLSETNHGVGRELPLNPNRTGHLLLDSYKGADLGNNIPIIDSFLEREYTVHQYFAQDSDAALRYKVIPMLYKAAELYQYDIMAWSNSAMFDKDMDILMAEVPILNVVDWVGATVKAGRFYSDVYVSRSNLSRYLTQATRDGLIAPHVGHDKINYNIIHNDLVDPNPNGPVAKRSEKQTEPYDIPQETLNFFNEKLTKIEFFTMLKNFMVLTGEEEMNQIEQNAVLAAYGAYIPFSRPDNELEVIKYLLARGIIDPAVYVDYAEVMTIGEVKTYLMRMKDKGSRLDFKTVTVPYNASLVNAGHQVVEVSSNASNVLDVSSYLKPAVTDTRDIFIKITPETRFRTSDTNSHVRPVFTTGFDETADLNGSNVVANVTFVGEIISVTQERYYHFRHNRGMEIDDENLRLDEHKHSHQIPLAGANTPVQTPASIANNQYFSINSHRAGEVPYAIAIPISAQSGGVFEFDANLYQHLDSRGGDFTLYTENDGRCTAYLKESSDTMEQLFGVDHRFYTDDRVAAENSGETIRLLNQYNYSKYIFYLDSEPEHYIWGADSLATLYERTTAHINSAYTGGPEEFANNPFQHKGSVVANNCEIRVLVSPHEPPPGISWNSVTPRFKVTILLEGTQADLDSFMAYHLRPALKSADHGPAQIAYVAGINSILIPYSHLVATGHLNGMAVRRGVNGLGDVYIFYGPNTNIYVAKNFRDTGVVRAIYGNMVTDFYETRETPIVVASNNIEDVLIDYRLVYGVTQDFLNLKSATGEAVSTQRSRSSVDSYVQQSNIQRELIDSQGNRVNLNSPTQVILQDGSSVESVGSAIGNEEDMEGLLASMDNLDVDSRPPDELTNQEPTQTVTVVHMDADKISFAEVQAALEYAVARGYAPSSAAPPSQGMQPPPPPGATMSLPSEDEANGTSSSIQFFEGDGGGNSVAPGDPPLVAPPVPFQSTIPEGDLFGSLTLPRFLGSAITSVRNILGSLSNIGNLVNLPSLGNLVNPVNIVYANDPEEMPEEILARTTFRINPPINFMNAPIVDNNMIGYRFRARPYDGATVEDFAMMQLEVTNYLGNYLIYQRRGAGFSDDHLIVFKPYIAGDTIEYDMSQWNNEEVTPLNASNAHLRSLSLGMHLGPSDNEIASIINISRVPFYDPRERLQQGDLFDDASLAPEEGVFPLGVSKGPFGFQYSILTESQLRQVNDHFMSTEGTPAFNLHNYLSTASTVLPLPYFGVRNASSHVSWSLLNYMPGNISIDGHSWLISLSAGRLFWKLDLNSEATGLTETEPVTIDNVYNQISVEPMAPQAVISRMYLNPFSDLKTPNDLIRNPRSAVFYNGMPLRIIPVQNDNGTGVLQYELVLGTDRLKVEEATQRATIRTLSDNLDEQLFRRVFFNGRYDIFIYEDAGQNFTLSFTNPEEEQHGNLGLNLSSTSRSVYNYDFDEWQKLFNLNKLEFFFSLAILALTFWIPAILNGCLLIMALLSLVKDFAPLQWFCTRVFDIFKILSFGITNYHEVRPLRLWIVTFIVSVLFGMMRNGILLDIISWILNLFMALLSRFM